MRSLCLLLGKEPLPNGINYLKLTCPTDPRRLDAYTMNHFANSNEVREYFQEQIEDYLNKNKSILEEINNRIDTTTQEIQKIIATNGGSANPGSNENPAGGNPDVQEV